MVTFTAQQIAERVHGELVGSPDLTIDGVEQLDRATARQLTFVRDQRHVGHWMRSQSKLTLVSQRVSVEPDAGRAVIRVPNADVALAIALEMFAPAKVCPKEGVHPSASVDPTATLGANVAIGPGCVVGAAVHIGAGSVLHANVTVMDETKLGADCQLYPGVVVRDRCRLGDRVILHPNVVIGADGFGYTPAPDGAGFVKIPHIGNVVIEDDVEIGAGTCIDRGKTSATTIGKGTKIDNLCQIAHNCQIGKYCLIAAQSGLAGSVTLGDRVSLGGHVGIRDQVHIGAGAQLAAYAAVMEDVPENAVWGGTPAQELRQAMREVAAVRKLPDLFKTLRAGRGSSPGAIAPR